MYLRIFSISDTNKLSHVSFLTENQNQNQDDPRLLAVCHKIMRNYETHFPEHGKQFSRVFVNEGLYGGCLCRQREKFRCVWVSWGVRRQLHARTAPSPPPPQLPQPPPPRDVTVPQRFIPPRINFPTWHNYYGWKIMSSE